MDEIIVDVEIIQEFIQESREMIEQLEPTIIELGQSCREVDCWEVMNCDEQTCPSFGQKSEIPCWLQAGFIGNGTGACTYAKSKQDCLACEVFQLINGNAEVLNAIFRLFHSIKGSAAFLGFKHISHVSHAAENLLDLIRSGEIRMNQKHVNLLCRTCDFSIEALNLVEKTMSDQEMVSKSKEMAAMLQQAITASNASVTGNKNHELVREEKSKKKKKSKTKKSPKKKENTTENSQLDQESLITPDMIERFVLEADELLQEMEQGLLDWLKSPEDKEIVAGLFRHIHSLKGNAGFLGYPDLERLSHQIETLFDLVKRGAPVNKKNLANLFLQLKDVLRDAVAKISQGEKGEIPGLDLYIELLGEHIPAEGHRVNDVDEDQGAAEGAQEVSRLGDILVEQGAVSNADLETALEIQKKPVGKVLVDIGAATKEQVNEALKRQEKIRAKTSVGGTNQVIIARQDIRVDLRKLDVLINLIGELVISENMLVHNQDLEGLVLENFAKASQQMNKHIRELQEVAMTIRMIPVSGLFRRMIRLVHDLSGKFGKQVDLQLSGEETEVDKTVIEIISDPLVHLIRNCLDHGLESPEERAKTDKPETGVVKLSARHEEGEVWITIEDDGKGLNREKILAKAVEKGLVEGDGSKLSERDIYGLILLPGFSTTEKVSDVSGRGVGMDVVKQNLAKIKGRIEIQSKAGLGTRMTLRIPLTLAIIEGMSVRVGSTKCIIPILVIREFFRPNPEMIISSPDGQTLAQVRKSFHPVIRLHEWLKKEPDCHELCEGVLIVIDVHDRRICLFVDEILGQQQTVIKGLPSYIGKVHGISGCTILGNGEVSLILDLGSLIEQKENDLVGV